MKFTSIEEAIKKGKGNVSLRGWIYRERGSNKLKFIVLRDSTEIIQCVIDKDKVSEKEWNDANKLLIESSVELEGDISKDERAPTGYEVKVSKIKVIHFAEKYPITKDQSTELLADYRHLWIRSLKLSSIMKIRSTVFGAIHEFFRGKGYYEFQSPIIIPGGAEEGPTLFEIKYFNQKMYLTQTWQLYAEAAMFGLEKLYTVAPSFRAEKSKTSRHLTEYWHTEVEVAWFNLYDLMDLCEELIKHIVKKVLKENGKELKLLDRDVKKLEPVLEKKFPRITYTEALQKLNKKGFKIAWGKDLRTIEEEKLMDGQDVPMFVTHYPKDAMAFYKPKDPKDPRVAVCFDLIGPESNGELVGGSERDMDLKELVKSLKKKGENVKDYEYFLDTRKYGSIPHGGFGMGTERVIKWICGLDNIKDAIGFPRTMTRFKP